LGRYSLAELAIFDATIRANHWVLLCCHWDFLWLSRHGVRYMGMGGQNLKCYLFQDFKILTLAIHHSDQIIWIRTGQKFRCHEGRTMTKKRQSNSETCSPSRMKRVTMDLGDGVSYEVINNICQHLNMLISSQSHRAILSME